MEKLQFSILIKFFLAGVFLLFFFSCRIELTKRHYSPGYYIGFHRNYASQIRLPKAEIKKTEKKLSFINPFLVSNGMGSGKDLLEPVSLQNPARVNPFRRPVLRSHELLYTQIDTASKHAARKIHHKTTRNEGDESTQYSVFSIVSICSGVAGLVLSIAAAALLGYNAVFTLLIVAAALGLIAFISGAVAIWDVAHNKKRGIGFLVGGMLSGCITWVIIYLVFALLFTVFLFGGIR